MSFVGKDLMSFPHKTRKFFKLCAVADRTKIKSKLRDRGSVMHMVGYGRNCPKGTYRLINLRTRKIVQSCNVTFFNDKEKRM